MKDVFVVYGRKECIGVDFAFGYNNHLTEARVYGVFTSFETALKEFKKIVAEAREYFFEYTPFSIDKDLLDKAKEAVLFDDYNMEDYVDLDWFDEDSEECDNDIDAAERNDVKWECHIGNDNAHWEMYPTTVDPFEQSILASVYIQKEELKG